MADAESVLRAIDKYDRVGPEGVRARLTDGLQDKSGAMIEGVGLSKTQAEVIISFLDGRHGDGLDGMKSWFNHVPARFRLMSFLDQAYVDGERTYLDLLLEMPKNEDQTWKDGGRPANLGWAMDDIIAAVRKLVEDE